MIVRLVSEDVDSVMNMILMWLSILSVYAEKDFSIVKSVIKHGVAGDVTNVT